MDKKVKTLIAEKKLTDDQIFEALTAFTTADNSDADPDGEEHKDQSEEENSGSGEDQNGTADEDAAENDKELPNIQKLIDERIAEALRGLTRGKKPPKVKKKTPVPQAKIYNFNQEFGTIP